MWRGKSSGVIGSGCEFWIGVISVVTFGFLKIREYQHAFTMVRLADMRCNRGWINRRSLWNEEV